MHDVHFGSDSLQHAEGKGLDIAANLAALFGQLDASNVRDDLTKGEQLQLSDTETKLRADALALPSVIMQGITHIAPAAGLILTVQFITSLSGVTSPLAYAIAFVIVLTLGLSLTQLAKHLPSAGGYYTYVSRTVHPRAGFLTAWLYFLYDPTGAAINLAFMGFFIERTLKAEYSVLFPWWIFFLLATLLITLLIYYGIEISANAMMLLGIAEVVIVVALAVAGLLKPGDGGINFSSYFPGNAPSLSGLYLGVVFSIFCFTGFESVAPLAEESKDPRRNLPRAIVGAILLMGVFYLFCSWAVLVGWGTDNLPALIGAEENPVFLLGRRLWGRLWILVPLALLNSVIAVSIACTNAATRVFYAMGRAEALPAFLAKVHPKYQTPSNAIWLQTLLTLVVGLGLGFWIGPDQEFLFMAVVVTLGMTFVYCAGNLGVFLFYRGERRVEFSLFMHAIFPLVSTIALIWVAFKSIIPLPAAPLLYAPLLVLGWLVLGAVLLAVMRRAGRESWLLKAGQVAHEQDGAPQHEQKM